MSITASDASSNEEVEFLKQTVSELSRQIATLQTELNAAKLQEFEAQEANVAIAQVIIGGFTLHLFTLLIKCSCKIYSTDDST